MDSLRIPLVFLAAAQGILVFCGVVISLFADGGFWWERIPMLLLHLRRRFS